MAYIYRSTEDGEIIELTNWGQADIAEPDKAFVGRKLTDKEMALYQELKAQEHSDSSIWLQMHPNWPRGNGREILRPLQRPSTVSKTDGKLHVPIRQLTTVMLTTLIEARCGTSLESLTKMLRRDLEMLAISLLGRDYILLDLEDC